MDTDPVCSMEVPLGPSTPTLTIDGIAYHFCSSGCRDVFAAGPDAYVGATAGQEI